MSEKVTLDRIDFEKLKEQANAVRVEYMHRYGRVVLGVVGSTLHAHHLIAVVAVLLISFGVKMCPSVSSPLPCRSFRSPSSSEYRSRINNALNTCGGIGA